MAIATGTLFSDDQLVRLKVSWSAYEALVEALDDNSHAQLTYDGTILEIMSPGSTHEFLANLISDMLAILRLEWSVALTNLGSATFKTEPRGFEADTTYYLNAKGRVRDISKIDLAIDPPPDLLIEIDIASSSRNRFVTYASIGVPEVWRYDPDGFSISALVRGQYVRIDQSGVIAGLPASAIAKRLEKSAEAQDDILTFLGEWQQWLRDNRHLHESD